MSEHTPGPWEFDGSYIRAGEPIGSYKQPVKMSSAYIEDAFTDGCRPDAEFDANMRLISAAPDLLQALIYMVNNIGQPCSLETRDGFNAARAAIAKATGEQQ